MGVLDVCIVLHCWANWKDEHFNKLGVEFFPFYMGSSLKLLPFLKTHTKKTNRTNPPKKKKISTTPQKKERNKQNNSSQTTPPTPCVLGLVWKGSVYELHTHARKGMYTCVFILNSNNAINTEWTWHHSRLTYYKYLEDYSANQLLVTVVQNANND